MMLSARVLLDNIVPTANEQADFVKGMHVETKVPLRSLMLRRYCAQSVQ